MKGKAVTLITSALAAVLSAPLTFGSSSTPDKLRKELKERLIASQLELTDTWRLGKVRKLGAVLVLLQDHVPAREFHTLSQQKPYPRVWHLDSYARVEIRNGQVFSAQPRNTFNLKRGELLVVLDHKFKGNTIELWTHTLNPVLNEDNPGRTPKYASTKFVFHFRPEILRAGSIRSIENELDGWFKSFESEWEAQEFAKTLPK